MGLSLALAKQPRLLLLDEPVAALDPLARREFLASLAEAAAEGGPAVILSSHLLHDLERVCDHLILLSASRTQLCDSIDNVVATHRVLIGPRQKPPAGVTVVKATNAARQTRLLARLDGPVLDPSWDVHEVALEDIVLAYMGEAASPGKQHADRDRRSIMNTLTWRLNRSQAKISAAALAALAVLLLITGIAMAGTYHGFLGACAAAHTCADAHSLLFQGDGVLNVVAYATMAVPLLFGLFWGAPLLAREFEAGTHSLAWTQGVTRQPLAGRHRRLGAGGRRPVGRRRVRAGHLVAPARERGRHPLSPVRHRDLRHPGNRPGRLLGVRGRPGHRRRGAVPAPAPRHGHHHRRIRRPALRHRRIPPAALHDPAHQGVPARGYGVRRALCHASRLLGDRALSAIGPNGHNYGDAIQFSFMPAACRSLSPGHISTVHGRPRVPRPGHLPARDQVLGLPGHRGRHLRRARRRPHRPHLAPCPDPRRMNHRASAASRRERWRRQFAHGRRAAPAAADRGGRLTAPAQRGDLVGRARDGPLRDIPIAPAIRTTGCCRLFDAK